MIKISMNYILNKIVRRFEERTQTIVESIFCNLRLEFIVFVSLYYKVKVSF